jgi:hypothetical protein
MTGSQNSQSSFLENHQPQAQKFFTFHFAHLTHGIMRKIGMLEMKSVSEIAETAALELQAAFADEAKLLQEK